MKTNIIKKITAASLTVGMMATVIALPVVKAVPGGEMPKQLEISKVITKEANVYLPKATFNFEIKPGEKVDATADKYAVYAGIEGGVTFIKNTIESAPAEDTLASESVTLTEKAKLQINADKFKEGGKGKPGIYRYLVKETASNTTDGITYDNNEKYFDVYVNSDGEAYSYAFVKKDNPKTKDTATFTNDYGKTHQNTLHDLTVSKKVTGTQGDKNKLFKFNIKIDGEAGEKYYLEVNNQKVAAIDSGTQTSFNLADGQKAVIKGVDGDDKVTLSEDSYVADGYKTTATLDTQTHDVTFTNQLLTKDSTVEYTNDKSVDTPTGIVMTFAPYVLLVLGAGVFFVMFKKKKDVEEI